MSAEPTAEEGGGCGGMAEMVRRKCVWLKKKKKSHFYCTIVWFNTVLYHQKYAIVNLNLNQFIDKLQ